MDAIGVIMEMLAALAALSLFTNVLYYAFLITMYVLGALGLYTIAKRRQISNAWMAWVPVLSHWTLGSLADQYQYVTKGKICNLRKWLIGLMIVMLVLLILICVFAVTASIQTVIYESAYGESMDMDPIQIVVPLLVVTPIYVAAGIALTVLMYVSYYRIFASCDPENKTLYLVLGILFNFLLPIFVFTCRKKDLGMPPRSDTIPVASVYQSAPIYQAPVEPWNLPPEQDH